ncbi:esterase [Novosphingobium sp. ST904]|nr:esterase [Novosphingobium sp. ST904]TCM26167.1 phospholipase/carboxylesterase [Novosphingobium sp. ST904]
MVLDGPRLEPLSGSKPDALVVLIHGYGSNGDDLISLGKAMQPSLPGAAFVAPNAPDLLPFTADAHQWWPIETFSMAERTAGADAAAPNLDAFLSAELEAAGIESSRLLLIGFSQGTMMALHVGLRRPTALAGIIGISGMLVAPDRLETEIGNRLPVLLIHGTDDDVVPFQSMELASTSLKAAKVPVETHASQEVGHWVSPDGLEAAIDFAGRVLA